MTVQNLANIRIALKQQAALGTPETGAGAVGLEVIPSQGIAMQVASIESQLLQRSRMKKRSRQGSRFVTAAYETELMVGALDVPFEGVLGGTWGAGIALDESDYTSITITGTGTIITAAGGSFLTAGVRPGMMGRFTNLSVAANNGKWFPILTVTATVLTAPSGILIDNALDNANSLEIAPALYTATTYEDRLFTLEEFLEDIDRSKRGVDLRFNRLAFDCQPDQFVRVGLGLGGRDMAMLEAGSSPNFTDPTFVSGSPLVLLDGGIYVNGVKRTNLTGFTFGLEAPVTGVPVIGSRISPDAFIGQFALTGQFTGVVEDGADFDAFDDEDQISVHLHCAEQDGPAGAFTSFYLGNLAFGGYSSPAGGEGALIQTIPLYGGSDDRANHAPTSVLISQSLN